MKKIFHVFSMLLLLGSLQVDLCAMQEPDDATTPVEIPVDHPNSGLINGQSICYLNAVIQCLSNLKTFREKLLAHEDTYQNNPLVLNLIRLFKDLRTTTEPAIQNDTLIGHVKTLITNQSGNAREHFQDADEILTLLLGQINKPNKISLELQLDQKVKCLGAHGAAGCQHESPKHETHETIALPLDEIATQNTLQALLESFFTSSFAHDYVCDGCGKKNTSFKTSRISKNQDELIITLKRFNSDGTKIDTSISFPMELDLKPYSTDGLKQQAGVDLSYELVGFVCHGGNHYISFVRDFGNGEWYMYNDSAVSDEINLQLIQGITTTGSFSLNSQIFTPYILFYQKNGIGGQTLAHPTAQQSVDQDEGEDWDSSDGEDELQPPTTKGFFSWFLGWATGNNQREDERRKQEEVKLQEEAIKKRQEEKLRMRRETRLQEEVIEKRQNLGLMKVEALPYLNSVVQCLSNLKKFKTKLFASENDYKDDFLILSLINLIKRLKNSSESLGNQDFVEQAKILVQQSKNNEVALQVADEFLNLLFDRLHTQDMEPLNLLINIITQCIKNKDISGCEYSLDEDGVVQPKTSLCFKELKSVQEILAKQFSPSFDKGYTCKCCHKAGTSVITQKFLRCPSELIISLQRFDSSGNKDLSPVILPLILDLTPYLSHELLQQIDQAPYELVGIVCCNRNSQYYSYMKNIASDKWFRYNDESVVEVSNQEIKTLADSGIDSQNFVPYILFYELKESECHTSASQAQQSSTATKDQRSNAKNTQEIMAQMTKLWNIKKQQERDLKRAQGVAKSADKNLVNAQLDGADLTDLDLNGADLTGASLIGATLVRTKLNGTILANAKLNNAIISDVQLCNATLKNTDLNNSTITNITAHNITISDGTKFENATISSLNLKNIKLQNVSFANATLKNITFSTSLIDHVNMAHIQAEELYLNESSLTNIDFSRACIVGLDISNANIIGDWLNFRYATIKTGCIRGTTTSRRPSPGERSDGITEKENTGLIMDTVGVSTLVTSTAFGTVTIPIPIVGSAAGFFYGLFLVGVELIIHDEYLDSKKDFGASNINSILLNSDFYGASLQDVIVQHVKLGNCMNIGRIRKAVGTNFDNIVSSNPKDLDDLRHKGACVNEIPSDEFKVLWPTKGNDQKVFWVKLLAGAAHGTLSGTISKVETNLRDKQQEAKYKSFISEEIQKTRK